MSFEIICELLRSVMKSHFKLFSQFKMISLIFRKDAMRLKLI